MEFSVPCYIDDVEVDFPTMSRFIKMQRMGACPQCKSTDIEVVPLWKGDKVELFNVKCNHCLLIVPVPNEGDF